MTSVVLIKPSVVTKIEFIGKEDFSPP